MWSLLAPFAAIALGVVSAAAESTYPDIRGTWSGASVEISRAVDSASPVLGSDSITQVITEQTDRRFAGTMTGGSVDSRFVVTFVGIFIDESHFRWSEPNGFVDGRMLDSDTIESCYTRISPYSQTAACQTLTRQK